MSVGFQEFQRAMAAHIRDPRRAPRPAGVPARRMAAYNTLLFNNLCSFLDSCFPVGRSLLQATRWRRLQRRFFRDWPLHAPQHREIPREFVRYLQQGGDAGLPRWFAALAHYEWAELAVDLMDAVTPPHRPDGDLLRATVVPNPALMVLAYDWPVHRIGTAYRPRRPQATQLVVYRDAHDAVQFMQVNAVTARLLGLLTAAPTTGEAACRRIAAELQHPDPGQLLAFGAGLLQQLRAQGLLLGTQA